MANVLVIDDDKNILRLIEFSLKRAGHQVTICEDGVQGIAQVRAQTPDIIIADVMMPKMTGYEFCKQVRTKLELPDTPIIMFSARFQPIDKQTALEAGASDFLPKTTSPDVLLKRVEELLPKQSTAVTHTTIGLFSLRGGVGVTSLGVNLALALAAAKKTPSALVDLAPVGGHAALMLGLRPTTSLADALFSSGDNVTLPTVKPHLLPHNAGVHLLASALVYEHMLHLSDSRLAQVVTALKTGFAFTILDIPHLLEPRFEPALQLFDKLVLILSPDMPSLQSTAMALQGLARLNVPENKIIFVVNHVLPQGALPAEVIQKTLKRPVLATIPFEPEMIKAVNSGKPLVLSSPQSAGAAAITRMASALFG
jgi:CheY-like chemotaxis protein/MinD-like ATPase involved in chromosome partitioning or flagellar assembly